MPEQLSEPHKNAQVINWRPGNVPVAVIMITLNEAHNMESVLENLKGWAREVFVVDSYSADDTVDIALRHGAHVVQRCFRGFGDQWNFALGNLPITAPWTMKLDPDERLTDELKHEIEQAIKHGGKEGLTLERQLWFIEHPLPIRQILLRVWKTGKCQFSDVLVNEHPIVEGKICHVWGDLEHHDSPDLHHWYEKQNKYSTAEAVAAYRKQSLSVKPSLGGNAMERRMWIKQHFFKFPLRYSILFWYHYLYLGAWRAGWPGYVWSRLRCEVYRMWEYKLREIELTGREPVARPTGPGQPDPRVEQF